MSKKTAKPKQKQKQAAHAETTEAKQNSRTRGLIPFKPGQSGNPKGRPPGSRNALCKRYIEDLKTVWDEIGIKAVRDLAKENPAAFARLVGALVPAEYDLGDKTRASFTTFLEAVRTGKFQPRTFDPDEDDNV